MKFLNVAIIFSLLSASVYAENPFQMSTAVTVAPTVTVPASSACAVGGGDDEYGICQAIMISGSVTLISSALLLLKEEIKEVESDALNFLAGEDMTLALQDVLQKLRAEAPELQDQSDEALTSLIIQSR